MATGSGTKDDPWVLTTPPGTSGVPMWRDDAADPPAIVCQVGGTQLKYDSAGHRRPPRDAQGARRLDAARWRRRAEAGARGLGRGLGPLRVATRSAAGTASRRACAAGSASTCRRCSRRSAWPRSPTTPRTTGCARALMAPGRRRAPSRAAVDGAGPRRPVRGARRPQPPGDRRAARVRRPIGPAARRCAADQPPGRLAPPAPPQGGRPRRRGTARHPPDLPAPRRGRRGRPRLPGTGLGRGVRRFRIVAENTPGRTAARDRATDDR